MTGTDSLSAYVERCQLRTCFDDLAELVVGEAIVPRKGEAFKPRTRRRYSLGKRRGGG